MNKKGKTRRKRDNSKDYNKLKSKIYIPSCIFNTKLSSFETIVKFLRESHNFNFKEIARLLGKEKQSVWRAYKNSTLKSKKSFEITNFYFPIPLKIFADSELSILEALVVFLKQEYNLTYSEISALLMRDPRTIWTVYQRAGKKNA